MSRNIETIDSSLSQDPACVSLLPKTEADERYTNNMFGQFKGFTITPIHSNQSKLAEPTKPAPPPPPGWMPTVAIKTNVIKSSVQRCNALQKSNLLSSNVNDATAPMLPPLNPGSTARPLISSPVLAATTCTSVELVTAKIPTRPAPDVPMRAAPAPPIASTAPAKPQRPNSTPLTNVVLPEPEKKPDRGSTLNRIASILRPGSGIMRSNSQRDERNTNSLPRNQHHKANKVIDKEILRNLEISNPIPQKEIEIATPVIPVISAAEQIEKKNVVLRAQSMRDSKITPKPLIHTFGSIRQTTPVKRPTSIPASTRPTSPPPGPPNIAQTEKSVENAIKIPGLPGYQNPPMKPLEKPLENVYDDCMNLIAESSLSALTEITEESPTNDNIYAVIEESVPEKNRKNAELEATIPTDNEYKLPKRIDATSTGGTNDLESMGLLSEIVSEISNRHFDSIYSTSTLSRKKRENNEKNASKNAENTGSDSSLGSYMNSSHYKTPGSVYSNSTSGKFNSSSSTTSSGYLHPSVINVPQVDRKETDKSISDANDNLKPIEKSKLDTLKSNNPNINDELSKELGMKPPENPERKPFAPTKIRPSHLTHIKKDDQAENKIPVKPPLNRTKTPPNIAKSPTSRETTESSVKLTRQSSDNMLKSLKSSSKASDASSINLKQRSDARQTQLTATKSNSELDKEESRTTVSVKNVPCSPKDNPGKFNSPDLVSSCSNSNQGGTKSPDVVGGNPKFSLSLKTSAHKISTLPRNGGQKTPTTPLKPLNITSKTTGLSERKKSPTGNTSVTKSLSLSVKDSNAKGATSHPKISAKTETIKSEDGGTRSNPLQRAASGKSNVASLQQKFEANKNNSGVTRTTISSVNNKKPVPTRPK